MAHAHSSSPEQLRGGRRPQAAAAYAAYHASGAPPGRGASEGTRSGRPPFRPIISVCAFSVCRLISVVCPHCRCCRPRKQSLGGQTTDRRVPARRGFAKCVFPRQQIIWVRAWVTAVSRPRPPVQPSAAAGALTAVMNRPVPSSRASPAATAAPATEPRRQKKKATTPQQDPSRVPYSIGWFRPSVI